MRGVALGVLLPFTAYKLESAALPSGTELWKVGEMCAITGWA